MSDRIGEAYETAKIGAQNMLHAPRRAGAALLSGIAVLIPYHSGQKVEANYDSAVSAPTASLLTASSSPNPTGKLNSVNYRVHSRKYLEANCDGEESVSPGSGPSHVKSHGVHIWTKRDNVDARGSGGSPHYYWEILGKSISFCGIMGYKESGGEAKLSPEHLTSKSGDVPTPLGSSRAAVTTFFVYYSNKNK